MSAASALHFASSSLLSVCAAYAQLGRSYQRQDGLRLVAAEDVGDEYTSFIVRMFMAPTPTPQTNGAQVGDGLWRVFGDVRPGAAIRVAGVEHDGPGVAASA